MTESRRWPDMDADEARFVEDFAPSLGAMRDRMKDCPPLDVLLAADAEVLPQPAAQNIAAHLDGCAMCQAMLRDAREAGIDAPSDAEAARILRRARVAPAAREPQAAASRREPRVWRYLTAASVAAALLVGLVAWQLETENRSLAARLASGAETERAPQLLADLQNRLAAEQSRAASAETALAALKRRVDAPEPSLNVPLLDLEPVDAVRSASTARRVVLPESAGLVSVVLSASSTAPNAEYALDIRDASGTVVWQGAGLRKSALNTFNVVLPRSMLPTGAVTLRLYVVERGERRLEHQYAVQVIAR